MRHPISNRRPLVVDLDGALSRVDPFQEAFADACLREPLRLPVLLGKLLSGRDALVSALAEESGPWTKSLPLREDVVDRIREAKREGRRVVLATGASDRFAKAVAERVGEIDEVVSVRTGGSNRSGEAKAMALVERFGEGGFDYIGASRADVATWKRCSTGYVVGPPALARRWSAATGRALDRLPGTDFGRASLRALRPHQWIKNILVFLPVLAGHRLMEPGRMSAAFLLFVAFCAAASCVYLANDLFDRESDRRDPSKAARPLASGSLRLSSAVGLGGALLLALALVCTLLPWRATAAVGVYLVANVAYTTRIKRTLLADVFLLAFMYVWRIAAGGLATGVEASVWLLGFSTFLFLSLAFAKRYVEVVRLAGAEREPADERIWKPIDALPLAVMGMGSGVAGSIVLALYVTGSSFAKLYRNESLVLLLSPLFLYWITRIWILACRKDLPEDPVLFVLKDRNSHLAALVAMAILGAAMI